MSGLTRLGAGALALAGVVIAVDQAVKYWVLDVIALRQFESRPLLGPIHLTGVANQGVSFGLLQANHELVRWGLVAFSIGVAIMLAGWVRRADRPLFALAIGLIMGGAIGNVIDRIRFGAVTDFIDVSSLRFPWVFNVADSAITIGIGLLLLDMLRQERDERREHPAKDAA